MLEGLSRFPNVRCLFFPRALEVFSQQNDEVTLHLKNGRRAAGNGQSPVAGSL